MTRKEAEVARLMQLLARLVRLSGMSTRAIAAKIGFKSSAISKILTGQIRPNAWHLLAIAAAIGLTPREFFSRAYPAEKQAGNHPLVPSSAELDRMVEAALRRALLQGFGSETGEPKL